MAVWDGDLQDPYTAKNKCTPAVLKADFQSIVRDPRDPTMQIHFTEHLAAQSVRVFHSYDARCVDSVTDRYKRLIRRFQSHRLHRQPGVFKWWILIYKWTGLKPKCILPVAKKTCTEVCELSEKMSRRFAYSTAFFLRSHLEKNKNFCSGLVFPTPSSHGQIAAYFCKLVPTNGNLLAPSANFVGLED